MALDSSGSPDSSTWVTSAALARVQAWATRLRFVLALPAAALAIVFTDRGPMWPGVLLALWGEAIQVWASAHLRKNVEVAMSGPYAWVRNPMYLGRFLVGLGLALLTWRWFLILPYIAVFSFYAHARVLGEEARLRRRFGESYTAYCAAARRWLPLPPRRRGSEARWSWACVLRNHELRVAVGVIAGLLLLKWRLTALGSLWQ
jgi:protein-S-isoprenylcysteine O-methyltransferase Ste14